LGALLLGYYTKDGRLRYAGCAGTGFTEMELKRLAGVLKPLETQKMPLDQPPPRENRFGSPLELSPAHWVRPTVVVEVTYLTRTEAGLPGRSGIRAGARTSRRERSLEVRASAAQLADVRVASEHLTDCERFCSRSSSASATVVLDVLRSRVRLPNSGR